MSDSLPKSLQESILAALIFTSDLGSAIATQVQVSHFDDIYRPIVSKVLDYRRKYTASPGTNHIDDLLSSELAERDKGPWLRSLLGGLLEASSSLNSKFILDRTGVFIRTQELKTAIKAAADRYTQGGEARVEDIEHILSSALRTKAQVLEPGMYLKDTPRLLSFLDANKVIPYPLGIPQIDKAGIGAVPKELLLYIAPKGTGKTWFCVHMALQGLVHRAKVLHISLETREEVLAGRYCQAMFSAGWEESYEYVKLERDDLGRLFSGKMKKRRPKINLSLPGAKDALKAKLKPQGMRFGNCLLIKEFPTGRLTIPQLDAFLDYLDTVEGFVPTLLIVDSPYLMKLDPRNLRLDLSRTMIELRGLASYRNLALVATHQSQRSGIRAKQVRATNVAESVDVVFTADNVLTYSQTAGEAKVGFGRLTVEYARNRPSGTQVLLVNGYSVGQYVLDSAAITNSQYWAMLKDLVGDDEEED